MTKFLNKFTLVTAGATLSLGLMSVNSAQAGTFNLTVQGTDAIYLAGRADVTIPPLGSTDPSFPLGRHSFVAADFLKDTFPQFITASGGQLFSFSASGCVHYFNGVGCPGNGFAPDGNSAGVSDLSNLSGISGYKGSQGPLVGLFLNDNNPVSSSAPTALDFTASGLGTDFSNLAPELGQVFFIGDGLGSSGTQIFKAPEGSTRLFLGIPDGFGFVNSPGAYEDNDGSFNVTVNVEDPTPVPEPSAALGLGIVGLGIFLKKKLQSSRKA
ncbi:MAG TPA: PEP-CTERM sorting domain-containing protein [Cyanobacteria bacterium UBA8803]|nr:PEP-CTERM sorting domain-containing protein [Cyanobacteria bacterium UBA9273]HBL59848.1 PEP-CTERM sorting domain-containing protein [Cyanobacteria bacterium UBA8803]